MGAEADDLRRVGAAVRQAEAAVCLLEVAAIESSRSAPHRGAACAPGSVRWEVPAVGRGAESDASQGPDAGHPCPADRAALGVAAAAWSSARFCLIELDTSRLSGLPRREGEPEAEAGPAGIRTAGKTRRSSIIGSSSPAITSIGGDSEANARNQVRASSQAAYRREGARPHRFAVGCTEIGLGWLRLLRRDRQTAAEGLRAGHIARRTVRARQRRALLPVVQHQ